MLSWKQIHPHLSWEQTIWVKHRISNREIGILWLSLQASMFCVKQINYYDMVAQHSLSKLRSPQAVAIWTRKFQWSKAKPRQLQISLSRDSLLCLNVVRLGFCDSQWFAAIAATIFLAYDDSLNTHDRNKTFRSKKKSLNNNRSKLVEVWPRL